MVAKLQQKEKNLGLTIVVPVHNISGRSAHLARWIPDAIRGNVRVILVHDRSQDSTQSELEMILKISSSPLITLHEVDFQSPGLTRNFGLNKVTTPWFSFADADDFVNIPNMLRLVSETDNTDSTMGIGAYLVHNLEKVHPPVQMAQNKYKANLPLQLALQMGLWRCVFSSSTTLDLHFDRQRMGEDFLFMNRAIDVQTKIHVSNLKVYTYYSGGIQNLTSNQSVMVDMFEVIDGISRLRPKTRIAKELQIFSIQKLSISVLKNVPPTQLMPHLPSLIYYLFSRPTHLFRLLSMLYFARSEDR